MKIKRGDVFALIAIFGMVASVIYRFVQYPESHLNFFSWIFAGAVIGLASSFVYVWKFKISQKKAETFLGITSLFLLLSVGVGFILFAANYAETTSSVKQWKTTTGKITGQKVHEAPPTRNRSAHGRFSPTWNYTFEVKGKSYEAYSAEITNAYALDPYYQQQDAELALKKRPIGSDVLVYYDPADPERSVLDPLSYNSDMGILLYSLGAIISLMTLIGMWAIHKKIQTLNQQK